MKLTLVRRLSNLELRARSTATYDATLVPEFAPMIRRLRHMRSCKDDPRSAVAARVLDRLVNLSVNPKDQLLDWRNDELDLLEVQLQTNVKGRPPETGWIAPNEQVQSNVCDC
jgi:hypothetical protein